MRIWKFDDLKTLTWLTNEMERQSSTLSSWKRDDGVEDNDVDDDEIE